MLPFVENFNDGTAENLEMIAGGWTVNTAERYHTQPADGDDPISLIELTDDLPDTFSFAAIFRVKDGGTDHLQNASLIFDYQSPTDFKYAGAFALANRFHLGHYDGTAWNTLAWAAHAVYVDVDRGTELIIDDSRVQLLVEGDEQLTHDFAEPLNDGRIGVGTHYSHAVFDDLEARTISTVPYAENFDSGPPEALVSGPGNWYINPAGRLRVEPLETKTTAAVFDLASAQPDNLEIAAIVRGRDLGEDFYKNAAIIFDYQSPTDFKYAGAFARSNRFHLGHYDGTAWNIMAWTAYTVDVDVDMATELIIDGSSVQLLVEGDELLRYNFAELLNDGRIGVGTQTSYSVFDNLEAGTISTIPYAPKSVWKIWTA